MQSVCKMPLNFLIWLFYLPRLSRAYRGWGWKAEPRLFKMEWKTPHNLAPTTPFLCHHFFHTTSLQETAPGFPKPHSVFGNSLMLPPLCLELLFPLLHVAKFYSTFRDQFQPLLGKVFPDSSLNLTYFSSAKMIIYLFSIFFIPKVINAYHNIWLVICLLWPTLSISQGIVCLILCLPSTQHSAYHSRHPINICWVLK